MTTGKITLSTALLALVLAIPGMAFAAPAATASDNTVAKAQAFVQDMAKGDFTAAEADFTAQMQQGGTRGQIAGDLAGPRAARRCVSENHRH